MTSTPSENRQPLVLSKYHHLIRPTNIAGLYICTDCSCALRYQPGDDANWRAHLRDAHSEVYRDLLGAKSKRGTNQVHLQTPADPPTIECRHRNDEFLDYAKAEASSFEADSDTAEMTDRVNTADCEVATGDSVATSSSATADAATTTDDINPLITKLQRLDSDDDHPDQPDTTTTVAQPTLTAEELLRHTAEMCAIDLRALEFCDGPGFANLVMALSGHQSCPGSDAVRAELLRMRAAIHRSAGATSRQQPFALGLEGWVYDDGQRFQTLSLLTDGADNSGPIRRQSLCTWPLKATTPELGDPWRQAIDALDMQQCQAIVLNFDATDHPSPSSSTISDDEDDQDDDEIVHLPSFVKYHKLAQVRCLAEILDAVIMTVLSRPVVLGSFDESTDLSWLDDMFSGSGDRRPREPHERVCLRTLITAVEKVRLEIGATAALNLPLCRQLVENHFGESAEDDWKMRSLKHFVRSTFKELFAANEFLSTATFLDPRFKSIVAADPVLLKSTIEIVRGMCPQSDASGSADKPPPSVTTATATNGNAGLVFVFGAKKKKPLTPLDAELQRYAAAETLNWEGCPRQWWSQQATAMPLLADAARKTFCVPAVLPLPMPSTLERRRGISADMAPTDLDVLLTVNESLASRAK